ncbi:single-stranded DNA-binding protein [Nocardia donostiensis]|uniref:single-stranded DNA-binding protein n=1 Tax=Nocardia donostiensis TaxID=1538463 RepID=UPI0009DB083C|nr:single-stranded DNA-binding protein [Nocardia donostiensis]
MYETIATVVGTVVTHPVKRVLAGGEQVLTFRMASNARRLDHDSGEWVDSGTLFLTVNCWRKLVAGVDASIGRGDPVIVQGQLRSNEYRTRDGVERRDLEMRANAVGPDLSRCTATVRRWRTAGNNSASANAEEGQSREPEAAGRFAGPSDPAVPGGERALDPEPAGT